MLNSDMAVANLKDYLRVLPAALHAPEGFFWTSYDQEADVLYINFKKPGFATDSELTDEDGLSRGTLSKRLRSTSVWKTEVFSMRSAALAASQVSMSTTLQPSVIGN